jgi:hypothetical protein
MFSSKLASFAQACPTELVGTPITDIIRLYDTVYMMIPFRNAVCSKDDSGRYCATEPAASSSASGSQPSPSGVVKGINQKYLWDTVSSAPISRRDLVASVPNITTFAALNIAFLLLQPNLSASALCTTCTRNIITSYISFETDVPHACGIAQSTLLVGQTELYKAIQSKCGTNFLSGAVEAAGGIAGGLLSGAPRSTGDFNAAIVAVMLGIVGLGFTVVL